MNLCMFILHSSLESGCEYQILGLHSSLVTSPEPMVSIVLLSRGNGKVLREDSENLQEPNVLSGSLRSILSPLRYH